MMGSVCDIFHFIVVLYVKESLVSSSYSPLRGSSGWCHYLSINGNKICTKTHHVCQSQLIWSINANQPS